MELSFVSDPLETQFYNKKSSIVLLLSFLNTSWKQFKFMDSHLFSNHSKTKLLQYNCINGYIDMSTGGPTIVQEMRNKSLLYAAYGRNLGELTVSIQFPLCFE